MCSLRDNTADPRLFKREQIKEFFALADKPIRTLVEENEGLLVYPYCIKDSKDKIGDQPIFSIANAGDPDNVRLVTGNIMGFIGRGGKTLKIGSRFDNGRNDFLLHYMLQKVFFPNIFDLPHGSEKYGMFDFLMFMFPHFLNSAMKQGVYREYRRFNHNDTQIKGTIDIAAHIRNNIPFTGNVAYTTREHTSDNALMQLVRHTIEYMKTRSYGSAVLHIDRTTSENVAEICRLTPSYNKSERQKVIRDNLRPIAHPYYTEYRPLQQVCLQILRHEEVRFGDSQDEICGILFDGAWLWEEYVNTILSQLDFEHPRNKEGKGAIFLFRDVINGKITPSGKRFLDFYKDGFVLDAKYKRIFKSDEKKNRVSHVDRDDIHQVMAYMYYYKAPRGGFICPFDQSFATRILHSSLVGYGGTISVFGIKISTCKDDYFMFTQEMAREENLLLNAIDVMLKRKPVNGTGQYADIHWESIKLSKPVFGYDTVHLMPYRITEEMLHAVTSTTCVRSDVSPDIDKNGSGNIHPSRNDVASMSASGKFKQLVLVTKSKSSAPAGPALPKDVHCEGTIYDLPHAKVPAANFYPMISRPEVMTSEEIEKQEYLKSLAMELGVDI